MIILLLIVGLLAACSHSQPVTPPVTVPIPREESTLSWDRNSEADMQDYVIYGCEKKDCTPTKAIGTVRQTALGVKPEFTVYIVGKVGAFGVTARDTYGNESGLSNVVPFDRR